jgi:ABC-type multidrug transport system ATPase subunit
MPDAPEAKVRARVAQFGLAPRRPTPPAKDLSGGEKARLLMGLAAFDGPHLLILDEPTNHLDIDSREALVEALNDFPGAVILISHDRHLLEATADRLWLVKDGTVKPFDGDMDNLSRRLSRRGRGQSRHPGRAGRWAGVLPQPRPGRGGRATRACARRPGLRHDHRGEDRKPRRIVLQGGSVTAGDRHAP